MKTFLLGLMSFTLLAALMVSTSAAKDKTGAQVGAAAPAFTLEDQSGQSHNLSDFAGKVVVLEWFNDGCPFVVKHYKEGHMNKLADKYEEKGVVWLAINSTSGTDNDHNKQIAKKWKIDRPILNDAAGAAGHAYGATNTPHMFVIDKEGKVAYMGAIDDNDDADTAVIADSKNHVAAALDAVLAGEKIQTPQTKPYGCTVKYAE